MRFRRFPIKFSQKSGRNNPSMQIFAWTLYDFANTAFSVIVVTVVFPIYFRDHIVGDFQLPLWGLVHNPADFLWSLSGSASMFLVALSSPVLGAVADLSQNKKFFVFIYSIICITSTSLLYLPQPGMIGYAMLLFIVANFGFEGALVFYNGFLPKLSTPRNIGKISGYGFALGYLGALFALLIALHFASAADSQKDITRMAPSFIWAAVFFLVFSLPFFFFVQEQGNTKVKNIKYYFITGFGRTRDTLYKIRQYKELTRFLIAYFVYIDGVNTVIFFGALFASDTLGFTTKEVIIFFAILQFSAIAGSFYFGWLTDRLGPGPTVKITLIMWVVVTIGAFFSIGAVSFYIVGIIAGAAMGAIQAASRALMALFVPKGMEAEFYGFYALMGKFSAILGPLVFGVISALTGDQRWAILSISAFFVSGYLLLSKVRIPDMLRTEA